VFGFLGAEKEKGVEMVSVDFWQVGKKGGKREEGRFGALQKKEKVMRLNPRKILRGSKGKKDDEKSVLFFRKGKKKGKVKHNITLGK